MTSVLSTNDAFDIIKSTKVGHLGCIDQTEPYVVPINYVVTDGFIYSHSLPGKKIDAMRSHPRVCLQVDQVDDDFHWRSAIAFGNYEEIQRPGERRSILTSLISHFPGLTPVESMIAQDTSTPDSIVFRIVVDRVTGIEER